LVADIHERQSGIAAELMRLGVDVEERRLEAGDYLLGDVALIERKSVPDLHQSVSRGHFWAQVGKLRRATRWPYLLIEGRSLYDGCLSAEAVRGLVIAVCDLGVTVCRSEDVRDSAAWIRRIAARRDAAPARDRPVYAQRPKRRVHDSPSEQALSAARGVSVATARDLLARFGTLLNVLSASQAELESVPGVGPEKATGIRALATDTSHSGLSRNGRHLST
jgi:DNA excision repair protein ERCC-4